MKLPSRNVDEEKAFISAAVDFTLETLLTIIEEALHQKRPQLAGHLACLVEHEVPSTPGSALEKARVASQLWLVEVQQPLEGPEEPGDDFHRPTRYRSRTRREKSRYRRILMSPNRRPGGRR